MNEETLSYVNSILQGAGINYSFERWNGELAFPYWVGEYSETDGMHEDGMTETDFILTGTTEGTWLQLHREKELIESLFRNRTVVLSSGTGLAIYFERALIVPTETEVLKRMQINISIREWRKR